jgi:hypothetical protein
MTLGNQGAGKQVVLARPHSQVMQYLKIQFLPGTKHIPSPFQRPTG